ncbi:hypothetical protein MUK42_17488 [Musa troglodytarum]|uniref:Uncharacterized protein n=1 Tax=Musa troglodytarum TaxID=320322 RepID=A0A9E7KTZ7_9LILI|nr:hypothetical protein MUK42_17488 [Musa troglodytarum]
MMQALVPKSVSIAQIPFGSPFHWVSALHSTPITLAKWKSKWDSEVGLLCPPLADKSGPKPSKSPWWCLWWRGCDGSSFCDIKVVEVVVVEWHNTDGDDRSCILSGNGGNRTIDGGNGNIVCCNSGSKGGVVKKPSNGRDNGDIGGGELIFLAEQG